MDLRVKLEAADESHTAMMKMGDRIIAERKVAAKAAKAEYERGFDDGKAEKKPWVGLTDEEINSIEFPESGTATMKDFVRIIESKLKEKNT